MDPLQIERQDPDVDPHQSGKLNSDPHKSGKLDPHPHQDDELDPDPNQFADNKQNVWNVSLFEHFLNVLRLYW
jgi:hypothetical protein